MTWWVWDLLQESIEDCPFGRMRGEEGRVAWEDEAETRLDHQLLIYHTTEAAVCLQTIKQLVKHQNEWTEGWVDGRRMVFSLLFSQSLFLCRMDGWMTCCKMCDDDALLFSSGYNIFLFKLMMFRRDVVLSQRSSKVKKILPLFWKEQKNTRKGGRINSMDLLKNEEKHERSYWRESELLLKQQNQKKRRMRMTEREREIHVESEEEGRKRRTSFRVAFVDEIMRSHAL